jgi:hypothetical protein
MTLGAAFGVTKCYKYLCTESTTWPAVPSFGTLACKHMLVGFGMASLWLQRESHIRFSLLIA